MVGITEIPHKQQLHVIGSDRYTIRDTRVHDDVLGRFVEVDDIVENMDEVMDESDLKKCVFCGDGIIAPTPIHILDGKNIFCSVECRDKWRKQQ